MNIAPDFFRVDMPKRSLVFFVVPSLSRVKLFDHALLALGGVSIGPQLYAFDSQFRLEAIKGSFNYLEKGECIYLLAPDGDCFNLSVLLPPKIEGGISVAEV